MATTPKPFQPRTPIIEQLAHELQKTDGSLNKQQHGAVYRNGDMGVLLPWDMSNEWSGRALEYYDWRASNWSKTIAVRFYVVRPDISGRSSAFTLHLTPPLSDAEVSQIAETYMMVLNMRRKEKCDGNQ